MKTLNDFGLMFQKMTLDMFHSNDWDICPSTGEYDGWGLYDFLSMYKKMKLHVPTNIAEQTALYLLLDNPHWRYLVSFDMSEFISMSQEIKYALDCVCSLNYAIIHSSKFELPLHRMKHTIWPGIKTLNGIENINDYIKTSNGRTVKLPITETRFLFGLIGNNPI